MQTPNNVSGGFFRSHLMDCMVGASRREGCEEGNSVEGPVWAKGGWLQTGNRLTGPRSQGIRMSPAGRRPSKAAGRGQCCNMG